MKKRFFSGNAIFEEPTVNLTPLIDVVFVILIMFIVIAPLLEIDRIELAHSSPALLNSTSAQEGSPISIYVNADNTILFNKKIISIKNLLTIFKEEKLKHPQARPQIFHDRQAKFGTYQEIKNAAEEAGFSHIDIILKPS